MAFPAKKVMSFILIEPRAVLIITKKTQIDIFQKRKKDQKK